jgi:hypothetical protein
VHERLAGIHVAERGESRRDLLEVVAGPQSEAPERRRHRLARVAQRLGDEQRQHVLRGRQGHQPEHQVDLLAEAAARHQRQAVEALRELVSQLHRDPAAERVPDVAGPLDLERDHQVANPAGVGAQRVVAARLGGIAVAQQVRSQHREVTGQLRQDLIPGRRAPGDAVDQHYRRPLAADPEADAVPVQVQLLDPHPGPAPGSLACSGHLISIPEIARAITSRWISAVPSKIV